MTAVAGVVAGLLLGWLARDWWADVQIGVAHAERVLRAQQARRDAGGHE